MTNPDLIAMLTLELKRLKNEMKDLRTLDYSKSDINIAFSVMITRIEAALNSVENSK